MVDRIMAKMLVHSAKKAQPGNYITILYSPECDLDFDNLNRGGLTPHWILCVKAGESFRAYWDRSGKILKAIALQANDANARRTASELLISHREVGQSLWRWKMAFLPTQPP